MTANIVAIEALRDRRIRDPTFSPEAMRKQNRRLTVRNGEAPVASGPTLVGPTGSSPAADVQTIPVVRHYPQVALFTNVAMGDGPDARGPALE